jgi:hypothetical protein
MSVKEGRKEGPNKCKRRALKRESTLGVTAWFKMGDFHDLLRPLSFRKL